MNKPCSTCGTTMRYMGEWPCLAANRSTEVQCHRWICHVCKTVPFEPINAHEAHKLELVT